MVKAVFNWSGGKDSALALWQAQCSGDYDIVALLTTVNRRTRRSTMHSIPMPLLERQARCIGLPLYVVDLTPKGDMSDYGQAMAGAVEHFKALGVSHFIFGDIFLHDVRSYRVSHLAPYGMSVVEPLWNRSSAQVMDEFLGSGLKTVVVTTNAEVLDSRWIGRHIDRAFVDSLPPSVDPCGENGEYHTFCYDGPIFRTPVSFTLCTPFLDSFPVRHDDGSEHRYSYWFAGLDV